MNSFISNFRWEARTLAALAVLALAGEAGMRAMRSRLSLDVINIGRLPSIAQTLASGPQPRLLFLGNSLTRTGVDLAVFRQVFQSNGATGTCEKAIADDTTISDWYYEFESYFERGNAPDYLILGYVMNQLSDAATIHPERIAAYFGGWSVAPEVFHYDLAGLDERVEYALASSSVMFAEKERIRSRVLSILVPDYRATAQRLNESFFADPARAGGPYTRLARLLRLCKERRVQLVAAAMPLPGPYPIDPALASTLEAGGGMLFDLRSVAGISRASFLPDGFHLAPAGSQVYSRRLAEMLQQAIAKRPAGAAYARTGNHWQEAKRYRP